MGVAHHVRMTRREAVWGVGARQETRSAKATDLMVCRWEVCSLHFGRVRVGEAGSSPNLRQDKYWSTYVYFCTRATKDGKIVKPAVLLFFEALFVLYYSSAENLLIS